MNTKRLSAFILARHRVWLGKTRGEPWPWTEDPVLRKFRFCNIRRNLDKETILIQTHWLHPHKGGPDLWFAMVVARLVNWWPSLAELEFPVPWDPSLFKARLTARKALGHKVFTGAYMVRADAVVSGNKHDYLADYVLTPLWEDREAVRPRKGDTLVSFHRRLMNHRDMGSFMAAQVVADLKYDTAGFLYRAKDWHSWAASGPGSRRGLSRVMDLPTAYPWRESAWRPAFHELWVKMKAQHNTALGEVLTGQDLQNCLCEFDKYERVRLGEGTPRSLYFPPINMDNL